MHTTRAVTSARRAPETIRQAVQQAVAAVSSGRVVVLADNEDGRDEGYLVVAAAEMTGQQMAFMLRNGSGIVCVSVPPRIADRLDLPPMVARSTSADAAAFTISVDHVTTFGGISATERAATVRAIAETSSARTDFRRPGHVFALRSEPGGVLVRASPAEAAMDLARAAGCGAAGAVTELVGEDGAPMVSTASKQFADNHGLPFLRVADLVWYRRRTEQFVTGSGKAHLPTKFGEFMAVAYRSVGDSAEHLALTSGDIAAAKAISGGVLVHIHNECIAGDVLGSVLCECNARLAKALEMIAADGTGVIVYLRRPDSSATGIASVLQRYSQHAAVRRFTADQGSSLGCKAQSIESDVSAAILVDLGVQSMRLMTNDPVMPDNMRGFGLKMAERVAVPAG